MNTITVKDGALILLQGLGDRTADCLFPRLAPSTQTPGTLK